MSTFAWANLEVGLYSLVCKFWLWKRTVCFVSTGQSNWSFSMSQRGTFPFRFPSLCTHMHTDTKKYTHVFCSRLVLGGSCHRTAAHAGNAFVNPSYHPYAHTITTSTSLRLVVLEEQKCICLSFICLWTSVWPGWLIILPWGGRRTLAAFREPHHSLLSLMDTQTLRHSCRFSDNHHLAGPWVEDMWPVEMHHNAGLSLSQIFCLSACLKITSLERLTETEMKEFCFPLRLQRSPSALSSPQLPDAVALCAVRWHHSPFVSRKSEHLASPSFVLCALSGSQMNIAFLIVWRI